LSNNTCVINFFKRVDDELRPRMDAGMMSGAKFVKIIFDRLRVASLSVSQHFGFFLEPDSCNLSIFFIT